MTRIFNSMAPIELFDPCKISFISVICGEVFAIIPDTRSESTLRVWRDRRRRGPVPALSADGG